MTGTVRAVWDMDDVSPGRLKQFFKRSTEYIADVEVRARRDRLAKFGAYVTMRAKRSIKKGRKVAYGPNAKPRSRTGELKRAIYFLISADYEFVTISAGRLATPVNVANLHEFGGRHGLTGKYYQPRPYMGPAFKSVIEDELSRMFTGYIITRG